MYGQAISRRILWGIWAIILVTGASDVVQAQAPNVISYQGRLTSDAGQPLDTTVEMSFAVFDDSLASTQLWMEVHPAIIVTDGLFEAQIGSIVSIGSSVFDGSVRWLGIAIGDGDLLKPLTPIVSTAYAVKSEYANTAMAAGLADTASYAIAAGHADTADLAFIDNSGWKDLGSVITLKTFGDSVGIGTETPDEMMHIYMDGAALNAYLKIQSGHVSSWGDAGIQFNTPENTWSLRMGSQGSLYVPPGALGLYLQGSERDVMTWAQDGNVGIAEEFPSARLDVNGSNGGTAIRGYSSSGYGVNGASTTGYGGYFSGPKHYFSNLTGFNTDNPTHHVTINGSIAFQLDGITEYHMRHYNGGLNLAEAGVADYRLFIKDGGNIGIGTGNPTAKLHVAGTFHADVFETDAIDYTNIVDEVGIASKASTASHTLTSSWVSYLDRQITVPAAGYILAIGYARVIMAHDSGETTNASVAFSDLPDDANGGMHSRLQIDGQVGGGYRYSTLPVQRLFYAPAAGTYTYYMIATRGGYTGTSTIDDRQMDLLYIRTVYSSKNGVLIENPEDNILISDGAMDIEREFTQDAHPSESRSAESVVHDNAALLKQIETLTMEMEALKGRLEAIEKK